MAATCWQGCIECVPLDGREGWRRGGFAEGVQREGGKEARQVQDIRPTRRGTAAEG